MNITVALDGPKQRDLVFYQGDTADLDVVVYQHDGDEVPVAVTGARILTNSGQMSFPVSDAFTTPTIYGGRQQYRLVAEISGNTTTLATGDLIMRGLVQRVAAGGAPQGELVLDGGGASGAGYDSIVYDGGGA